MRDPFEQAYLVDPAVLKGLRKTYDSLVGEKPPYEEFQNRWLYYRGLRRAIHQALEGYVTARQGGDRALAQAYSMHLTNYAGRCMAEEKPR